MSQKIFEDIDNIVDKKTSEYYFINKRKRNFWHSKSVTISWRVRNKNNYNNAVNVSLNIRAFLLNEEKHFNKILGLVAKRLCEEDARQLRKYVYSLFPEKSKKELDKKMGLIIMNLEPEELRGALNLEYVASCRLLGYEKELFYLKCYNWGLLPAFILRVLYHTKYDHLKLIHSFENSEKILRGLDFDYYLEKIHFK